MARIVIIGDSPECTSELSDIVSGIAPKTEVFAPLSMNELLKGIEEFERIEYAIVAGNVGWLGDVDSREIIELLVKPRTELQLILFKPTPDLQENPIKDIKIIGVIANFDDKTPENLTEVVRSIFVEGGHLVGKTRARFLV